MPMGCAHDTRKANMCRLSRFLTEASASTDYIICRNIIVFLAICLKAFGIQPFSRKGLAGYGAEPHIKLLITLLSSGLCLKAKLGVEDLLAETEGLGSYLDELVVTDVLNSLLKAEYLRRNETECLIRTG